MNKLQPPAVAVMSVISELAKLKESCVKGHHVYRADFVVGAVFNCEIEPTNSHSEWAIVVNSMSDL